MDRNKQVLHAFGKYVGRSLPMNCSLKYNPRPKEVQELFLRKDEIKIISFNFVAIFGKMIPHYIPTIYPLNLPRKWRTKHLILLYLQPVRSCMHRQNEIIVSIIGFCLGSKGDVELDGNLKEIQANYIASKLNFKA